jgi:ABC-type sugar transport system ATPase subunit
VKGPFKGRFWLFASFRKKNGDSETKTSIKFGGLEALRQLDLEVGEGEIFGLIGPNGAGKTTCLNIVTGFLKPTDGTVIYKGQPITDLEPNAIAKRGLVRTFQITNVFPNLTAEQNVIVGRYLRTSGNVLGAFFRSRNYRFQETILKKKAVGYWICWAFRGKGTSLPGICPMEMKESSKSLLLWHASRNCCCWMSRLPG